MFVKNFVRNRTNIACQKFDIKREFRFEIIANDKFQSINYNQFKKKYSIFCFIRCMIDYKKNTLKKFVCDD